MLAGPAILHVEVAKMSNTVVSAVKSLSFVSDVLQTSNTLRIQLATREDVRAQVSQEITRSGGIIVGMSLKGSNLEDVFLQLITKGQGGKAQ
jgi:hypothetical protein